MYGGLYIWLRYVDDTESGVEQFTQHLNLMDDNIKFTVEAEQNNTLAFITTCICLKDDGSTKVKVYQKATHTPVFELGVKPHIRRQMLSGEDTLAKDSKFDIKGGG